MGMFPLSSSLPLCNGVVVLDERPPIKGDGLGISGRLLVDGCDRRGRGGGKRERIVQGMRSHQSISERGLGYQS